MSTLMSNDMNISRPSTRVYHAPGGNTTICLGDDSALGGNAGKIPAPVAVIATPTIKEVDIVQTLLKQLECLTISESSRKVGLCLATSIGADEITSEISKSLSSKRITNVVVFLVEDPLILPFVVTEMTKSCAVVLAVGVLSDKTSGAAQTLTRALIQSGLLSECPVISGLINPSDLLELKAILPEYTACWTSSVSSILALQSGVTPESVIDIVKELVTITSDTTNAEDPILENPKPPVAPAAHPRRAVAPATTIVLG